MASCVGKIRTENYQNLMIGFQVTVENVGDAFWDTVYIKTDLDIGTGALPTLLAQAASAAAAE